MNELRDEILYLIARYQNAIRGIDQAMAEANGRDRDMLMSRRYAYELDMIPSLKRLLEKCNDESERRTQ